MARERAPPFCRHAGAVYQPVRKRIHRRAGLRARKALAYRHQRRKRLYSKVGDRRIGGALSARFTVLELPSSKEAIAWAARIAKACRCDQELRVFGFDPES